jgi:formate dehydrogenase (coenzyme F420) beta subunit
MIDYQSEIQKTAKELLESGEVSMVIGYGASSVRGEPMPIFISDAADAEKLIFNRYCHNNLSIYLSRMKDRGKLAVVAKPCDVRSIIGLIREKQIERGNLHIISFSCPGIISPKDQNLSPVCGQCTIKIPPLYDTLIGDGKEITIKEDFNDSIPEFESKSPGERWEILKAEMDKCIRCYACRNACPMCYCEECFVERSLPRWIGEGSELSDTIIFHIVRVLHSAGRCGECGACVNACPMGVNLGLLNAKINKDVLELFNSKSGANPDEAPALSTFKPDDYNDFIK